MEPMQPPFYLFYIINNVIHSGHENKYDDSANTARWVYDDYTSASALKRVGNAADKMLGAQFDQVVGPENGSV